jgi:hypothetical protein
MVSGKISNISSIIEVLILSLVLFLLIVSVAKHSIGIHRATIILLVQILILLLAIEEIVLDLLIWVDVVLLLSIFLLLLILLAILDSTHAFVHFIFHCITNILLLDLLILLILHCLPFILIVGVWISFSVHSVLN